MHEGTGEGATLERKQHGRIVVEARSVTKGGIVASYGNRDAEHCYLDWLRNAGHLGHAEDAHDRYDAGMRLRALWYAFNAKGGALEPGGPKDPMTTESEVNSAEDIAETRFVRVMRALPQKYRVVVRSVTIDDFPRQAGPAEYHELVRYGLDALWGAFEHVRRMEEK
ncbi:MAG: hypothetical protein EOM21_20730 [Gammaproteobacteria bacterium]|nr:hypothetical protein [Gammaproteobacteria bacterium]